MKFVVVFFIAVLAASGERMQLTCGQIRHFVDGHNSRRQMVARGLLAGQPAASDMKFLVWDEELAEKAAKWAETIALIHNPNRTIPSKRWDIVGENIYLGKAYTPQGTAAKPKIEEVLNCWFEENTNYHFRPYTMEMYKIGHYTQMVWANTSRFGCGISQKRSDDNWTDVMYVCNYGPTGNFIDHLPYKKAYGGGRLLCHNKESCMKPYGKRCSANTSIKHTFKYL